MQKIWIGLLAVAAFAATGCGNSLKCADGTFEKGDKCVGYDPDDETAPVTSVDPPVARSRNPLPAYVQLVSDEPAVIYFTTDGSAPTLDSPHEPTPVLIPDIAQGMTLRFFAVDLSGNEEAPQTVVAEQDITPPAAVGALDIAFSGTDASLTWANPTDADFEGVLLARIDGVFDFHPEPGELYLAGVVSSSVEIVIAGTQTDFADPAREPGFLRYAAWTYDDLGNYSPASVLEETVPLGSLSGSISVDVLSGAVTILEQPTHLLLSAVASYDVGMQELTVDVTLDNATKHVFTNPKLYVMNLSTGSFANFDGILDDPYRDLGPEALAPAGSADRDLVFSVLPTTTTVTFDVTLGENSTLLMVQRHKNASAALFVDSGSGAELPPIARDPADIGPSNRGAHRPGAASADRRWLYLAASHKAELQVIDRSSHALVAGIPLVPPVSAGQPSFGGGGGGEPKSSTWSVVRTKDGHLYALAKNLNHKQHGPVTLYRLDENLEITGTLALGSHYRARQMFLSPDEGLLAIAMSSRLLLVDLPTFQVLDLDPDASSTGLELPLDAHRVLFTAPDTIYVAAREDNSLARVVLGEEATVTMIDIPGNGRVNGLLPGPDGKIWIARRTGSGLYLFDPQSEVASMTVYPYEIDAAQIIDGELYLGRYPSRTIIDRVGETGAIVETFTTANAFGSHWLGIDSE